MDNKHDGLTTTPNKDAVKMEAKVLSPNDPMNPTVDPLDVHDSLADTLWMSVTGASANDQHDHRPGVDVVSIKVGHEPDRFNSTRIWLVPVMVAVTLVVVYAVVQGVFGLFVGTEAQQKNDPNFNERSGRIATTDGQPIKGGLDAVPQPRLEFIQKVDLTRNDVNGNLVSDPPYLRSFKPTPTGNSPEIYPEDLRTEHFVDPTTKTNALSEAAWSNAAKTVAVLPIDEMIHLMTHDAAYKLKVSATPSAPLVGTQGKPKLSTGGVTPPKPPVVTAKPAEPKKDDHKDHDHKH
jgi:hypothetical protein